MSELKSKIQNEINKLLESVDICETNIRDIIKTENLYDKGSYTVEDVQNIMEVMNYLSPLTMLRVMCEEL